MKTKRVTLKEFKTLIKKIIKEEFSNELSQEDLAEINKKVESELKQNKEMLDSNQKELSQQLSIVKQLEGKVGEDLKKLNPKGYEALLTKTKEHIDILQNSIANWKEISKEEIFNRIKNGYLSKKKYETERQEYIKNRKLAKEDLINLFVTALEGGSNYWYYIDLPEGFNGKSSSDELGNYVLNGGTLYFYDVEDWENILTKQEKGYYENKPKQLDIDRKKAYLGHVDMDKILEGITLLKKDYPEIYESILEEQYDANDADIFLQLIVMGEVVFG